MKPNKLPITLPVTLKSSCRKKAEPEKKLQLSHTLDWAELNYMGFCNSWRKGSAQEEHSKTALLRYRETGSQKLGRSSHPMAPWIVKVEPYSAVDFKGIASAVSFLPTADAFDWDLSSNLFQINAQILSRQRNKHLWFNSSDQSACFFRNHPMVKNQWILSRLPTDLIFKQIHHSANRVQGFVVSLCFSYYFSPILLHHCELIPSASDTSHQRRR